MKGGAEIIKETSVLTKPTMLSNQASFNNVPIRRIYVYAEIQPGPTKFQSSHMPILNTN